MRMSLVWVGEGGGAGDRIIFCVCVNIFFLFIQNVRKHASLVTSNPRLLMIQ